MQFLLKLVQWAFAIGFSYNRKTGNCVISTTYLLVKSAIISLYFIKMFSSVVLRNNSKNKTIFTIITRSSWEADVGRLPRAPGLYSETEEGLLLSLKIGIPTIFPEVKFEGVLMLWEFSLPLGWNNSSLCSQGHVTWLHLP